MAITRQTGEREILGYRLPAVFARDQVIYFMLLCDIVLVNQTELAAISGALGDQPA
jgi:sugar/nucleoside kinase (ribokinase family)